MSIQFFIILIANSILKPLNEVVTNLKDAAEGDGDLTTRIAVKSKDEIGELAQSFNVFIGKIQSIIKDVAQNSKELTLSAENLTNISVEMNSSSDQTSLVATNVASSSEDMKKNIEFYNKHISKITNFAPQFKKNGSVAQLDRATAF